MPHRSDLFFAGPRPMAGAVAPGVVTALPPVEMPERAPGDRPPDPVADRPRLAPSSGLPPPESPRAVRGAEPPGPTGDAGRRSRNWRPHRTALLILVVGLAVTTALTVFAQIAYVHNERRLTSLQASLTGSLLGTTPTDLEGQLARVAGLAAESSTALATYEKAIATLIQPKGRYASSTLALVSPSDTQVLDHVGSAPLRPLTSQADAQLFQRAAATTTLVTTRVTGNRTQKLAYLISAPGPSGTYVVSVAQQLTLPTIIKVTPTSPEADLNYAVYFGRRAVPSALVAATVTALPLRGIVSTTTVPYGTSVLTLVVSARGSLAGPSSEILPWGILVVGLLLTLLVFVMAERLVRRREYAEELASANRELYQQQRGVATTLQHALLPKALPVVPGLELAARYIPSARGVEIGGDWYSVIRTDSGRLVFVVGDVSGHGVDAASVMGSLRYTVRALARLGLGPAEILGRAGVEIDIGVDGHFATVLVGSIDLESDTMTLASAGHPPAVLVRPGESVLCRPALGPPLGLGFGPYRSTTMEFPQGWSLLAYTDGLVERRTRGIEEGIEALREAAAAGPAGAGPLVDHVVATLTDGANDDDIAVLCISR